MARFYNQEAIDILDGASLDPNMLDIDHFAQQRGWLVHQAGWPLGDMPQSEVQLRDASDDLMGQGWDADARRAALAAVADSLRFGHPPKYS